MNSCTLLADHLEYMFWFNLLLLLREIGRGFLTLNVYCDALIES